jgi:hypothetical protein
MFNVELTKDEIDGIIKMFKVVTISGDSAEAFVELKNKFKLAAEVGRVAEETIAAGNAAAGN